MKKCFILIPTLREEKNILLLLKKIEQSVSKIDGWRFKVLIAEGDKNSKVDFDKFSIDSYQIWQKKPGLGKALEEGLLWIEENYPDADYVITMDGDMSHNPSEIKKMVVKIDDGSNFVIGSRFIKDGSSAGLTWDRKILSLLGNRYINFFGGLKNINDCTSGFRCFQRNLLPAKRLALPRGYAVEIAILQLAAKRGAKITEVPINFLKRNSGKSKLKLKDIFEVFFTATFLKPRK